MNTLTTYFGYTFDTLVLVRVSSTSEFGTSDTATNLGNARIRSKPNAMSQPTVTSYSDTQITLTWSSLSGTTAGNSDILSYSLYWNKGTDASATTKVTEALINTFTFNSITGGSVYLFKVQARNIYDYGDFSSPDVSVTAVDIPGKVAIPTVTLSSTDNT